LPKDVRRQLGEVRQQWSERDRGHWRWVEPHLFHLTLVFLGERSEAELSAILQVAKQAVSQSSPFELHCRGLGAFPSARRPSRVLWAALLPSRPLLGLVGQLRQGLQAAEIAVDTKPFSAHITLARRRPGHDRNAPPLPTIFMDKEWGAWKASELVLMDSRLGKGPPSYNHRATWRI
jgi:2'-5' RNA ligase